VPDDAIHNPHDRPNWNFQSIWVEGDIIMLGTGLAGIPIQVVRSADHGENWESILPEGIDLPGEIIGAYLTDFSFAEDGLTGYASYWMSGNSGVAKTTDGGASWTKMYSLDNFTPFPNPDIDHYSTAVMFRWSVGTSADGNTIITTGSFGQVIVTVDGGESWQEILGGPHYGDRDWRTTILRASAISPDGKSWIAAGHRGLILGASNFDVDNATFFNGEEKLRNFYDISFRDEDHGIAVGDLELHKYYGQGYYHYNIHHDGLFFTTDDGGETWSETPGPGKEGYTWTTVQAEGANSIWVGGVKYDYDYDDDDDMLITANALISHSDDGGDIWKEQTLIPGRRITALTSWDEDHIYAATDGNTFLRSLNGEDWESLELPEEIVSGNHIRSIELVAPRTLFVGGGGNDAFIYQSTDAGENWELVSLQATGSGAIQYVAFVDGKHGFAGGRWGTFGNLRNLLYTSDYGENWEVMTATGEFQNYLAVHYIATIDSTTAFAYGNNGAIMNIQNGHQFEHIIPQFTGQTLTGGHQHGTQQLFLSGTGGTIAAYTSDDPPPSAPARFANTFPIDGEDIFIPWDSDAVFTWEEAVDHDGGPVTYVMILEDEHGDEEIFRSPELDQNHFAANTENFPSLPPKLYRWRVKAFNQNGLYSTSYPTKAFVDVDDFINDQNDIVAFSFEQDAEPAEIDTDNHTVNAYVIYGSDISNLTPEIEVSHNATIDPPSGEAQDFSDPVTYTVTAQNEDEQEWLVTVHIADPIDYISFQEYLTFDYNMTPISQLPVLDFNSIITNQGHRDMTQVTLKVSANHEVIGTSEPVDQLPMGESATLALDQPHQITEPDDYHFLYEIAIGNQNPNLVDHTIEQQVMVTDSVYATDTGEFSNSLGSNAGPISLANIYEVINQDFLTSISIGWGTNLPSFPLNFSFSIHRVNKETLTSEEEIFSSPTLQRFPTDALSIVSYGFPKIELDPGYYAIVLNQLTSEHIRLAFSDVPGGFFYLFEPAKNGSFQMIDDETFGFVMLRANFAKQDLSDDASLQDLTVDGQTIDGFNPDVTDYIYTLPEGTQQPPVVDAVQNDPNASIDIHTAEDINSPHEEDRTTTVDVTAEDGTTTRQYSVLFEITTDITETLPAEFTLYPNPAKNNMFVETDLKGELYVTITAIDGRIIWHEVPLKNPFDISSLEQGVYIVTLESDNQRISTMLSVVR